MSITYLTPLSPTMQKTCHVCNGQGVFESRFYSTNLLSNCQTCKGHGTLTICTSCNAQVRYSRQGISCGCNTVTLKVAA